MAACVAVGCNWLHCFEHQVRLQNVIKPPQLQAPTHVPVGTRNSTETRL